MLGPPGRGASFDRLTPYPKYKIIPIPNQMSSRSHVLHGSEIISHAADTAPAGATNHTHGVLNTRGRFGSRTRSTRIPIATITNASSVPMETRLAASRTVNTAEKIATPTPVTIDVIQGVWNLGWILLTKGGSRPSLDIVQKTRDWPRSMTRMTDERPAIAPSLISVDIQPMPARSATTAIGSGTLSSLYGTTPVAIADTTMYSTVQMSSEPMMPIGMSFCGFFAS